MFVLLACHGNSSSTSAGIPGSPTRDRTNQRQAKLAHSFSLSRRKWPSGGVYTFYIGSIVCCRVLTIVRRRSRAPAAANQASDEGSYASALVANRALDIVRFPSASRVAALGSSRQKHINYWTCGVRSRCRCASTATRTHYLARSLVTQTERGT